MQLIGMLDSPYVRRVAVSLPRALVDVPLEWQLESVDASSRRAAGPAPPQPFPSHGSLQPPELPSSCSSRRRRTGWSSC